MPEFAEIASRVESSLAMDLNLQPSNPVDLATVSNFSNGTALEKLGAGSASPLQPISMKQYCKTI